MQSKIIIHFNNWLLILLIDSPTRHIYHINIKYIMRPYGKPYGDPRL